ncbi:tetratricopeptide repeat protein [Kitasatospora sp. NPDC051853]|uniref:tetratricopeptide repeat protein n=1 Tax=Kitasatospora sp. NPDC051853 TaxID=3364058 RepID=UPI003792500D
MAPNPARAPWVVSLQPPGQALPVGGGTLVSDRLVLTCAHVVDARNPAERPEGPVLVRFPFLSGHEPVPARVVEGGWFPPKGWTGDLAVLRLEDPAPPGAEPAPLRRTDADVFAHVFRCYGFPKEHPVGGVSIRGEIVGFSEVDWLQLESTVLTGWATDPGFSGTPVWNDTLQGVVGVLGRRQKPTEQLDRRVGYALSLDAAVRLWPDLAPLVHDITEQERRERLARLLAVPLAPSGGLPRLDQLDPHHLGVSLSKYSEAGYEPYVERPAADRALDAALDAGGFVLVTGRSKSGKSRTLHERLLRRHGGARLVVPRRGRHDLADLSRGGLPQGAGQVVVWLDDLHDYLLAGALDAQLLDRLLQHDPPCLVVGTLTHRHREELSGLDNEVGRATRELLRRAGLVTLDHTLGPAERQAATALYPQEDFSVRGIGEMLVAAPALEARFNAGDEVCPAGWLLVRAAADWARIGTPAVLDEPTLRELFDEYRAAAPGLDLEPGDEPFRTGLAWARDSAGAGIALLLRATGPASGPGFRVFPYIAEYLDTVPDGGIAVPDTVWRTAARCLSGADLLTLTHAAMIRDNGTIAEELLGRILAEEQDEELQAVAALLLSMVFFYRRELDRAEELLRRAAGSGLANVAELAQAELAGLLSARGELAAARALLETAVTAQDPQVSLVAQVGLAGVLWQLGEAESAERLLAAVLAQGVEEVPPLATARLGRAMVGRGGSAVVTPAQGVGGQEHGKQPPALRTTEAGAVPAEQPWTLSRVVGAAVGSSITGVARASLGGILMNRGELDRAEELLRSVLADGNPQARPVAQASLGELLIVRGRPEEAADLLETALADSGPLIEDAVRLCLGIAWLCVDRTEEGERLLRTVAGSGHFDRGPEAMAVLGHWYLSLDDLGTAEEWLNRAIDTGHRDWGAASRIGLACAHYLRGDDEAASALLEEVAAGDNRELAAHADDLLGDIHARRGRLPEAVAAYRRAIASEQAEWAATARIDLAQLLSETDESAGYGGIAEAVELLTEAAGSPHPDLGPRAADLLGDLLVRAGAPDRAVGAYESAIASGHPEWSLVARIDLAVLLVDLDRIDESEQLLRELTTCGHAVAAGVAVAMLGVLLLDSGREAEGVEQLRTAVDTCFGEPLQLARFHLAKFLLLVGDETAGEALLRDVLADEPSEVTEAARARLGVLLLGQGHAEAAFELLGDVEQSDDPDALAVAYLGAGEHLLDVGELHAAVDLLEAAREFPEAAEAPRATALLGVARRALNELAVARELLTEALEAGDASIEPMVRRYLGGTLFRLGESEQAEQVLLPVAQDEDSVHRPDALLLLAQVVDTIEGREAQARPWFEAAIACGDPETERQALPLYASYLQQSGDETRARQILAVIAARSAGAVDDGVDPAGEEGADAGPYAQDAPARSDAPNAVTPGSAPTGTTTGPSGGHPPGTVGRPPLRSARSEPIGRPAPPPGLPAALLLLLAELADAEGHPAEAAYWRERADRTRDTTEPDR